MVVGGILGRLSFFLPLYLVLCFETPWNGRMRRELPFFALRDEGMAVQVYLTGTFVGGFGPRSMQRS